ncbi:MAG: phosphatase PAP2 family protein [Chloroflexota bacterium]
METIWDLGVQWIVALQGLGDWLTAPMEFFSFLGTEDFFMLCLPVIYWCINSQLGIQVAFILMFSDCLNGGLKLVFHGPRPYWYSEAVKGLAAETSFGVPSGHSQTAVSIWGMVAVWLRKGWVWLLVVLVIFLIGFSRMYLGVHFPHDVLLGWSVGALLLLLVVGLWGRGAAWLRKRTAAQQVLVAFLVSLAMILFVAIPYFWLTTGGWQPPAAWAEFAGEAVTMEGSLTTAGTLFGLAVGLVWLEKLGGFKTSGPFWQLVLRTLLGLIGVLAIRYGLKFIFPEGDGFLPYSLRYLRYAFIGAWVSGGAPWAFLRLKLAEKA